jgi:hypothetical protein
VYRSARTVSATQLRDIAMRTVARWTEISGTVMRRWHSVAWVLHSAAVSMEYAFHAVRSAHRPWASLAFSTLRHCTILNIGTVRGYRLPPIKYKFLIDGGTRAFVSFFRLWDGGPSGDVPMVATNARNATDKYRAKAYELVSLAERASDPEQRADLLRFARMWMSLTEPIGDLPRAKSPNEI